MKLLIYNDSIIFIEKQSFHGGNFPSVLFVTPFHSKPVIPFLLYISPILLGNIVGVEVDYECDSIVTAVLKRF